MKKHLYCKTQLNTALQPAGKNNENNQNENSQNVVNNINGSTVTDRKRGQTNSFNLLQNQIDENGILEDSAIFLSYLKSQPAIPLAVSMKIVDNCAQYCDSLVQSLRKEVEEILQSNNISNERSNNLLPVTQCLETPFHGLDTRYRQMSYLKRYGYYIEPKHYNIAHELVHNKSKQIKKKFLTKFLLLSGILMEIKQYLDTPATEYITDFKDALLWQQNRTRLAYLNSKPY